MKLTCPGDFLNGHFWGVGIYHYSDGGLYTGEFKHTKMVKGAVRPVLDSKRHGHGARTWTNGSCYEGEWREDQMDGNVVPLIELVDQLILC